MGAPEQLTKVRSTVFKEALTTTTLTAAIITNVCPSTNSFAKSEHRSPYSSITLFPPIFKKTQLIDGGL